MPFEQVDQDSARQNDALDQLHAKNVHCMQAGLRLAENGRFAVPLLCR